MIYECRNWFCGWNGALLFQHKSIKESWMNFIDGRSRKWNEWVAFFWFVVGYGRWPSNAAAINSTNFISFIELPCSFINQYKKTGNPNSFNFTPTNILAPSVRAAKKPTNWMSCKSMKEKQLICLIEKWNVIDWIAAGLKIHNQLSRNAKDLSFDEGSGCSTTNQSIHFSWIPQQQTKATKRKRWIDWNGMKINESFDWLRLRCLCCGLAVNYLSCGLCSGAASAAHSLHFNWFHQFTLRPACPFIISLRKKTSASNHSFCFQ